MKTNTNKKTDLTDKTDLKKGKRKSDTESLTEDPTKREQEISYKKKHKIGDPIKKVK